MWEAVRLYRQVRFVCMGWPDGNQRQSDGTDGWHAIRGNQRQSEAINPDGWHASRGNQRQSEAIRGNQSGRVACEACRPACSCSPCQHDISECTRSHLIASDRILIASNCILIALNCILIDFNCIRWPSDCMPSDCMPSDCMPSDCMPLVGGIPCQHGWS